MKTYKPIIVVGDYTYDMPKCEQIPSVGDHFEVLNVGYVEVTEVCYNEDTELVIICADIIF